MPSRSQLKQRRYHLNLTAIEAADLVGVARFGLTLILDDEEYEQANRAVRILEEAIEHGGEIWP